MPLSNAAAVAQARELQQMRAAESQRLELIHQYLRDDPDRRNLPGLPTGTPPDVVRLARISRVNLLKYIVNARVQAMYVDGYQTPDNPENVDAWRIWQANGFDARQIGVHRAALAFGAAYVTVLPGTGGVPVLRGASPRQLTAAYGDDDEWPVLALEQRRNRWRLIDNEAVYWLRKNDNDELELVSEPQPHGATFNGEPVCPVVRYRDTDDLDDPVRGIVEPHFTLQDQINVTTFGLLVAQHSGAFRQLIVIGWMSENADEVLKKGAARVITFEDENVKVEALPQTDLRGYIESREASVRHLATVSQTAVHELMGEFVNLSADALEAARASHQAAVDENRIMCGESHEQTLNLAGEMMGNRPDPTATVIWRDTRVRSLQEAAVALGTLVEKLGVPPRALWRRVPGVAQHEIDQWEALAAEGDAFAELATLLDRQAQPAPEPAPVG